MPHILDIIILALVGVVIHRVNKLNKEIVNMANEHLEQEAQLNEALDGLTQAVTTANQRVIDALEDLKNQNPDLTDEIARVQELAGAVNNIAASPTPPVEPEIPVDPQEPQNPENPVEPEIPENPEEATGEAGGDTSGQTTAEVFGGDEDIEVNSTTEVFSDEEQE